MRAIAYLAAKRVAMATVKAGLLLFLVAQLPTALHHIGQDQWADWISEREKKVVAYRQEYRCAACCAPTPISTISPAGHLSRARSAHLCACPSMGATLLVAHSRAATATVHGHQMYDDVQPLFRAR